MPMSLFIKNTRLRYSAFIKHGILKEKRIFYDLNSPHWVTLQEEKIIYIIVHVCNLFCLKADAVAAVWRTSEVLR